MDGHIADFRHIRRFARGAATGLGIAALAACGGGGSGGGAAQSTPPAPSNAAPSFSSAAQVDVDENTGGSFYTAAASDADGDTLSYSILSSGDGALFQIDTSSGEVSFVTAPDFEAPGDAGADNAYNLTIRVTDGRGGQADLAVTVTVRDVVQAVQVRRVGTGLSQPLYLAGLPDGSGRVLVVEKGGAVRLLNPDTGAVDGVDFMDVSGSISTDGERGLLGLALSPDFSTDRTVYVNVTNAAGDTEIRRYQTFSGRLDQVDPATADVILTIGQPQSNHNAGWIGFDASGFLVIPTGDGGGSGDPGNFAQNTSSLLGKVLRIDVSGDDFPADDARDYAIPAGNTFDGNPSGGAPEIFAIGVRNPFRASFDPATGDLLMADVGQGAREEVDRLLMDDATRNFGWRVREGTLAFGGANDPSFTPPVTEYAHGSGPREGRSITGGYVYTGPVEALQGEYVFADFISGNVWSVPAANLVDGQTLAASEYTLRTTEFVPDAGALSRITSFGLDGVNNLYITVIGGDVFRVEAEN